ncbi:MAG: aminopeptidase [Candidatus Bathyarchaeia archaeon]
MADERTKEACRNILHYELKAQAGESLLVIFDSEKERIADGFMQEASALGLNVRSLRFPLLERGAVLPTSVEAEARGALGRNPLVILMSVAMLRSAGMKRWVELIGSPSKPLAGRLFSDWVLPGESFTRVYSIDWLETARYRDELLRRLNAVKELRITTEPGTDIALKPRHWIGAPSAESFGSISEIFTAPVEESVNGTVIYDASLYWGKPRRPITVQLKRGRITEVEVEGCEDDEQFRMFMTDTRRDEGASVIAELGLGLNPGADPFGHVMEAERARSTCHFDLGDNVSFGGANRSAHHGGGVCYQPTLLGDGRLILERGFLAS